MKTLGTVVLLLISPAAVAGDLPQYEVSGFPITPVQAMVLQPTHRMREIPAVPPPESRTAIFIVHGNGRVYTVKFRFATPSERAALGRVQATQSVLFVDSYEPFNLNFEN